jgi:2-succinyl-5-enolpyruvyl-6-hydroxy-3-cyclohexene-1-carboxylate synthase
MTGGHPMYAFVGAFLDELTRAGVRDVCLCPGSRSTPLALCAAAHPAVKVWTLIDERSAAFFALGLARARRGLVALLSTSGTAAANFLPAVVEARYSRVPLLVLTADRPHELRDSGANQTIDQNRLYGTHTKWFVDMAPPEATPLMLRYARTIAAEAAGIACAPPSGAAHVNFPLREPLISPEAIDMLGDLGRSPAALEGRSDGRPYASAGAGARVLAPDAIRALANELAASPRGVIVCGPHDDGMLARAVAGLAEAVGYPVLADPLSGVRAGAHDRRMVVDAYDALLRSPDANRYLAPDVIVRFGQTPASKPLLQYLEGHPSASQIVVDGLDPGRTGARFLAVDPVPLCHALADAAAGVAGRAADTSSEWVASWLRFGALAQDAIAQHLGEVHEPFEGKVFHELAGVLPDGTLLIVGNSMPVRDVDSFFPSTGRRIRLMGNRGASGIDGLTSTALGAAAAWSGPVVAVLGDLSFYHDMNGLLAAKLHALRATIIVLNNDGGGIFSFLPQAAHPAHFEQLFGTPHGLDFHHAADLYGASFARADDWDAFREGVRRGLAGRGLTILEMRTDRARNVVLHREVWKAVAAAVGGAVAGLSADGREAERGVSAPAQPRGSA